MIRSTPKLPGYRGLRGEVLIALRLAQPLTAKELGARFGVTPNALRRHLRALEAEGVVQFQRVARGVGSPTYAYSLTERGDALFPRAYGSMLAGVLESIRERQGSAAVEGFALDQMRRLAATHGPGLAAQTTEERSRAIAALLTSHGFMAESSSTRHGLRIIEHNCAMHEVAREFPEICSAEAKFLEEVLGRSVEREQHMLSGCNRCEYRVKVEN